MKNLVIYRKFTNLPQGEDVTSVGVGTSQLRAPKGHDVLINLSDFDPTDDSAITNLPAFAIANERRMQMRAHHVWTELAVHSTIPILSTLKPQQLEEFAHNSLLLDVRTDPENPSIIDMGMALRNECGIVGAIDKLNDVPNHSLLASIPPHIPKIWDEIAPVNFEVDLVNQRGADILSRGILMPFSSDGAKIDFILAVINWKEMISAQESVVISREFDAAMREIRSPSVGMQVWPNDSGQVERSGREKRPMKSSSHKKMFDTHSNAELGSTQNEQNALPPSEGGRTRPNNFVVMVGDLSADGTMKIISTLDQTHPLFEEVLAATGADDV